MADLIIGVGNRLRGDDGVGCWLAERAEDLQPGLRVRCVQQLTPELAEELADADRVLFIDAWWPPPAGMQPLPMAVDRRQPQRPSAERPRLLRLPARDAEANAGALSHQLLPAELLAITALLHERAPQAWMLLIPARSMDHGREFSRPLQTLLPQAELLLRRWCARAGSSHA